MFEELDKEEREEKEETKKLLKITAYIVGALVIVGAIVYIASRGPAKSPQAGQSVTAAAQTAPDPVKDLKIVRAVMGKDPTGIRVMWSVQLQNKSSKYTYSDILYGARFIGPDGNVRTSSRDTIKASIAPGEEQKLPQFIDGVYDPNAATYQFVIVSAKSSTL